MDVSAFDCVEAASKPGGGACEYSVSALADGDSVAVSEGGFVIPSRVALNALKEARRRLRECGETEAEAASRVSLIVSADESGAWAVRRARVASPTDDALHYVGVLRDELRLCDLLATVHPKSYSLWEMRCVARACDCVCVIVCV